MEMPEAVRRAFRAQGRRGGRARARALAPATRRRIAAEGARARWMQARFGAHRFADLGLPGGALVDKGIADLAAWTVGETEVLTREALLVASTDTRLLRDGVPIARAGRGIPDADLLLYRDLEREDPDLAHERWNALRAAVVSLGDALAATASAPGRR